MLSAKKYQFSDDSDLDPKTGKFSYFKAPITNLIPTRTITLQDVHRAITGDFLKDATLKLRQCAPGSDDYRKAKATLLPYVTFAGTFTRRDNKSLEKLSGLMCLDFDHLNNLPAKRRKLIQDQQITPLLLFISPGGDGLKLVIANPHNSGDYGKDYKAVQEYFWRTYALKADNTQDPSRACFLCHDPEAYLFEVEPVQGEKPTPITIEELEPTPTPVEMIKEDSEINPLPGPPPRRYRLWPNNEVYFLECRF